MEPIGSVKRKRDRYDLVDLALCIICQEDECKSLLRSSEKTLAKIKKTCCVRKKLSDVKYGKIIDDLESIVSEDMSKVKWHRKCYSAFTDINKIQRLQKKETKKASECEQQASISRIEEPSELSKRYLRTQSKPLDWMKCIFCQNLNKEVIFNVTDKVVSKNIIADSKFHQTLCIQLSNVSDLIAAEGKYHKTCRIKYHRSCQKAKSSVGKSHMNIAMVWLLREVKDHIGRGHILQLKDVWHHYVKLSEDASCDIPQSFLSRQSTFREKLELSLGLDVDFIKPDLSLSSDTLLIPRKYVALTAGNIAASAESEESLQSLSIAHSKDDWMLDLIHVALKLRGDITSHPHCNSLNINENNAIQFVPDSLYMFFRLLYGGNDLLEFDEDDTDHMQRKDEVMQTRVLSIAQDVVYNVSGFKRLPPKHIGLATTLHQATRSRELVQLFHAAGHTISYKQLLQLDTTLAEDTLRSMDPETGAVIPINIVPGRFVHFSADNIDILDDTLDGKNTFHATQMACWQRGPSVTTVFDNIDLRNQTKSKVLKVPEAMDKLFEAPINANKALPSFNEPVNSEWFDSSKEPIEYMRRAEATNMAFFSKRQEEPLKLGWTEFNENNTKITHDLTEVGYMPIIQAPAHELDTLNTVVKRCLHVSAHLGQKYTVITVDQALFCKLMQLKWSVPEYLEKLFGRMGGLHAALNFLSIIGKHTSGCGLENAWVESGVVGKNVVKILSGKDYKKGMRLHKMTVQCLWIILLPQFLEYLETVDLEEYRKLKTILATGSLDDLIDIWLSPTITKAKEDFIKQRSTNPNFEFWWGYMDMVSILLLFIRAEREGLWDLYLHAFTLMLPYFYRYDHQNYARWGTVYVEEMHNLPEELLSEFRKGNFGVKRSNRKFSQVDADQAQEWLNGTGKRGGGIVGITKSNSALSRWALSFNARSQLSADTYDMFHLGHDKEVHSESRKSRKERDNKDETQLLKTLQRFSVFSPDNQCYELQNVATKDRASQEIQTSLLQAKTLGKKQLLEMVKERLIEKKTSFDAVLPRNNPKTFESLYDVTRKGKDSQNIVKADRNIFQRLLGAAIGGRDVNFDKILENELFPVPLSLAEANGCLRTGVKSTLVDILTKDIECPATITLNSRHTHLIVDGQALVMAIGKPAECATFGDLANTFCDAVIKAGSPFDRIDVVFDRYENMSIKSGTRKSRSKGAQPIRRSIENKEVPLPGNWNNFIALSENKSDLAKFLSAQLLVKCPEDKTIVISGGGEDPLEVTTSNPELDVTALRASHEEADTRMVLHAINSPKEIVVVTSSDTDVLLLLITHLHLIKCIQVWMKTGTYKKRKYIPIHEVCQNVPVQCKDSLLAFHAITGCDTTSYLAKVTKRSGWKVFLKHHTLLEGLGEDELTDEIINNIETFICRLYNVEHINSVDKVRSTNIMTAKTPEELPPTRDALELHIKRAQLQVFIWKQAWNPLPRLPNPQEMGWKLTDGKLVPVLMTKEPFTERCLEIVYCSCKKGCKTERCKCKSSKLVCVPNCCCYKRDDEQVQRCMNVK